ncbi:hypothetical protein SISSUDRAFT_1049678 [Sistotremastrum suecicum HHB10207 ss-3]|uniref:Methyltransferase domain-containing protein n=1 Tax=Sistotremastrum suecicum HHB10207 ss-3 TaxID=1314776 RepID=A0A166BMG9_9AGAM|nr:hypothetical protein SISSUDRAFT_1049678 [Sistotremastrum suecicum HHB10207 ss-3]
MSRLCSLDWNDDHELLSVELAVAAMSALMQMLMVPVELPTEMTSPQRPNRRRHHRRDREPQSDGIPLRTTARQSLDSSATVARRPSDSSSLMAPAAFSSQEPLLLHTAAHLVPPNARTYQQPVAVPRRRRPRTADGADSSHMSSGPSKPSGRTGSSSRSEQRKLDRKKSKSRTRTSSTNESPARPSQYVPGKPALIQKYGVPHHTFDVVKAPYPLSHDRDIIDTDIVNHTFLTSLKQSVSFMNFGDDLPERSLDLGCGSGVWVLDAARQWPSCEFVGFDLVPTQPKLEHLPKDLASRIRWVQGNFLTGKLPFEDDFFDHVHVRSIATAVPENLWDKLFSEINRVLRPGGAFEMIEEDILFPIIAPIPEPDLESPPLNSTQSPKASTSSWTSPPSPTTSAKPFLDPKNHPHRLLENLYYGLFQTRFINLQPTSIIPSYVNTYFQQVVHSPALNIPLPPRPPRRDRIKRVVHRPQPDPPPLPTIPSASTIPPPSLPSSKPFPSLSGFPPPPPIPVSDTSTYGTRSVRSNSASTANSADTDNTGHPQSAFSPSNSANTSQSSSWSQSHSRSGSGPRPFESLSQATLPLKPDFITPRTKPLLPTFTTVPATPAQSSLFPIQKLIDDLQENPYAFAYHLQKTYVTILAAKEAMWDELQLQLARSSAAEVRSLKALGWEGGGFRQDDKEAKDGGSKIYRDEDLTESNGMGTNAGSNKEWALAPQRATFDRMIKEFEKDMKKRCAFAHSVQCALGEESWRVQPLDPLPIKKQAMEGDLEKAIEALEVLFADYQESKSSRILSVFTGYKEG